MVPKPLAFFFSGRCPIAETFKHPANFVQIYVTGAWRMRQLSELLVALVVPFFCAAAAAAGAESCPQPGSEIVTDRPDVTNSSLVVPQGSFQQENGVNIGGRDGGQVLDGTSTRLRLGIAQCLEVLADVPTYFDAPLRTRQFRLHQRRARNQMAD